MHYDSYLEAIHLKERSLPCILNYDYKNNNVQKDVKQPDFLTIFGYKKAHES